MYHFIKDVACAKLNQLDYSERGNLSLYWNEGLEDIYLEDLGIYLNIEVMECMR